MSKHQTMSFISSGVFWGGIIILFGLSIILREIFHVHIPFVRIIFGCILIYWGIKMISGGFGRNHWGRNAAVFNEAKMNYDDAQKEYNTVFGSSTIDLFKMENKGDRKIEVNIVFGNCALILNDSIPIKVEISSAFASATTPDKNMSALGKSTYYTSAYKENQPYIFIEANVVFGKLDIESKKW
ncbi:MAG: LiaF-related protein [Bacteroidetes bacterium]|nr:LiaF-related protein [Bacteroidota bacterium]